MVRRAPGEARLQKFTAIESLRGYLAWWVVIGHAGQLAGAPGPFGWPQFAWLLNADMAVQLFMVISGFVIAHLLIERPEPYRAYIARRWWRLMPLFAAMTLAAILLRDLHAAAYLDSPLAMGRDMRLARIAEEDTRWPLHLALHATMLHGLLPDTHLPYASSSFLAPAWSISLEWQFYLLAPLILAAMTNPRRAWLMLPLLALAGLAWSGMLGSWRYQSFLPLALLFFLAGITSRLLLERRIPWLALAISAAALILHLAVAGRWHIWQLLPVAMVWLPFLALVVRPNLPGVRWLDTRASRALGRVSYSTYLAHIPLFSAVVGAPIALFGPQDPATIYALIALAVALTLPASFLLYRWVERPFLTPRRASPDTPLPRSAAPRPRPR